MGALNTKNKIVYEERGRENFTTGSFKIPNKADKGPMGFGVIPSAKAVIRSAFMKRFLTKLYKKEIKLQKHSGPLCWSCVSHTDPSDRDTATMNVAMPDFSAEYWCTYLPSSKFPIFRFRFPHWANYAALTIYDVCGLPLASINLHDSLTLPSTSSFLRLTDGTCMVNMYPWLLRKNNLGPLCAIFRVYRPPSVTVTPLEDMPLVYFVDRVEAKSLDLCEMEGRPEVPRVDRELARSRGKVVGDTFMAMIAKYLKPLRPHQFGTQFYHPNNVGGLFVNFNATYVIAFLPPTLTCLKLTGQVPEREDWRCYYGIMAVSYESTETWGCRTVEDLGGWGNSYEVYVTRGGEDDARIAGYEGRKGEFLMDWGGGKGNVGVVLRYLHYFVEEAEEERRKLQELDGRMEGDFDIPGLAKVEYF